jgi:hypothetical protein
VHTIHTFATQINCASYTHSTIVPLPPAPFRSQVLLKGNNSIADCRKERTSEAKKFEHKEGTMSLSPQQLRQSISLAPTLMTWHRQVDRKVELVQTHHSLGYAPDATYAENGTMQAQRCQHARSTHSPSIVLTCATSSDNSCTLSAVLRRHCPFQATFLFY